MTLTEFLLARIAEDEAAAQSALTLYGSGTYYPNGHSLDPARVLAECEAKRRIVQIVGTLGGHYEPNASRIAPEIVRQLALPYADHPDYREEWRP